MSEDKTPNRHRQLTELIGRTISFATFIQDVGGYDLVWIEFEGGGKIKIREHSQTGEIRVRVSPWAGCR